MLVPLDVVDNYLRFRNESVDKVAGEGVELCKALSWSHLTQSGDAGLIPADWLDPLDSRQWR